MNHILCKNCGAHNPAGSAECQWCRFPIADKAFAVNTGSLKSADASSATATHTASGPLPSGPLSQASWKCINCWLINFASASVCRRCGQPAVVAVETPLAVMQKADAQQSVTLACERCGLESSSKWRECRRCGGNLVRVEPEGAGIESATEAAMVVQSRFEKFMRGNAATLIFLTILSYGLYAFIDAALDSRLAAMNGYLLFGLFAVIVGGAGACARAAMSAGDKWPAQFPPPQTFDRIRGLMLLPLISVMLTITFSAWTGIRDLGRADEVLSQRYKDTMLLEYEDESEAASPMPVRAQRSMKSLFVYESLACFTLALLGGIVLIFFFNRARVAPAIISGFFLAHLGAYLVYYLFVDTLFERIYGIGNMITFAAVGKADLKPLGRLVIDEQAAVFFILLVTLAQFSIWTPYLFLSRRARQTFVR